MEKVIGGLAFNIPKGYAGDRWAGERPARAKSMAMPELLEAILLQLPMQDLLASCLRVSKTWNATITNSPQLQQALFFQPITRVQKVSVIVDETKCEKSHLGLIPTLNWFNPPPCSLTVEELSKNLVRFYSSDIRRNPIARRIIGTREGISNPNYSAAYARPEASWRRMLISQPPSEFLTPVAELTRLGDFGDACQTWAWLTVIRDWTLDWDEAKDYWSSSKPHQYATNGMKLLLNRKKWLNPSLALLPNSDERTVRSLIWS